MKYVGSTVLDVEWDKTNILSGVACNLDQDILLTLLPLFAGSEIEAIEWSFDALYNRSQIPDWFYELLHAYSDNQCLVGHGIYFSVLSGEWKEAQQQWLSHLSDMSDRFKFDHVTEHFGFTTGRNFHAGAPLGVPLTSATLAIGRDRLSRIQDAAQCPVGLENLAFAYHQEEVERQGEFLTQLIEPVNGFIILDLHNIYCQACNFDIDPLDLIQFYPLDRVREIHISGGSWQPSRVTEKRTIRRDTHDDAVPIEVYQILEAIIPLCPQLKYVMLEQLGTFLKSEEQRNLFRSDFSRMKNIVKAFRSEGQTSHSFLPDEPININTPIVDQDLFHQQIAISNILESATNLADAKRKLAKSTLINSAWNVEKWDDDMLDTAIQIAQSWLSHT